MFLEHSSPLSTGPRQPGVVISVHPVQGKPRFVPAALGSYASRTLPLGGRSPLPTRTRRCLRAGALRCPG